MSSRQGRSLADLVQPLEDFRASGVELVSFSEGLDFSATARKLVYQAISHSPSLSGMGNYVAIRAFLIGIQLGHPAQGGGEAL